VRRSIPLKKTKLLEVKTYSCSLNNLNT